MRVLILTAVSALALPIMAFGQRDEPQQPQAPQQGQEQTKEPATETKEAAPAKETRPARAQATPDAKRETKASAQENRAEDANRRDTRKDAAAGARSETDVKNENTTKTKVNVQEFRSRHADVFSLGVHPKTFFVEKYGDNHVRLIGDMYFVYVDGCWVSVHVDGYGYSERVICAGDPEFVEVY